MNKSFHLKSEAPVSLEEALSRLALDTDPAPLFALPLQPGLQLPDSGLTLAVSWSIKNRKALAVTGLLMPDAAEASTLTLILTSWRRRLSRHKLEGGRVNQLVDVQTGQRQQASGCGDLLPSRRLEDSAAGLLDPQRGAFQAPAAPNAIFSKRPGICMHTMF